MDKETLRKLTEPTTQPKIFDVEPNYQDDEITVNIGKLNATEWDEEFTFDKSDLALFLELDVFENEYEDIIIRDSNPRYDGVINNEIYVYAELEDYKFTEENIRDYLKNLNKI